MSGWSSTCALPTVTSPVSVCSAVQVSEVMYCNFTDGLQLVSAMPAVNAGGRPAPHGPGLPDNATGTAPSLERKATFHGLHAGNIHQFPNLDLHSRPPPKPPAGWKGSWPAIDNSIRHAGSWHNEFPGDVRVHPDPSGMVTFFDPALTSLVAARRGMDRDAYRPGNISAEDMARVRADVAEVVMREEGAGSGVDWRGLTRVMQERFADRLPYLRYLLHQRPANRTEQVFLVRKQLIVSLLPYMQAPGVGEPEWFADTARRCAARFTAHLPAERFTKQERVLRSAVDEVLHEICRVLTVAWSEAFDVEEKSLDVAVALLEKWRGEVDQLVEWLDWPVWLQCEPACRVDVSTSS